MALWQHNPKRYWTITEEACILLAHTTARLEKSIISKGLVILATEVSSGLLLGARGGGGLWTVGCGCHGPRGHSVPTIIFRMRKGKTTIDSCRMHRTACLDLSSFIPRLYEVEEIAAAGAELESTSCFARYWPPNHIWFFFPIFYFKTNLPEHEWPCETISAYFPYFKMWGSLYHLAVCASCLFPPLILCLASSPCFLLSL
jgi:hypothetical protein